MENTIKTLMGTELMLSDLHTSVVIPSYELETSSPFTFWHKHSDGASDSETGFIAMSRTENAVGQKAGSMTGGVRYVKGRDFKLWEVARASSAAPTYFPGEKDLEPPGLGCFLLWCDPNPPQGGRLLMLAQQLLYFPGDSTATHANTR